MQVFAFKLIYLWPMMKYTFLFENKSWFASFQAPLEIDYFTLSAARNSAKALMDQNGIPHQDYRFVGIRINATGEIISGKELLDLTK